MNSVQIEDNVKKLLQGFLNHDVTRQDFVYELLLSYGHRKSVVRRVKSGERNLAKNEGEVILKRHLYFKPCTTNLFAEIDALKNSKTVATNKIRFVVVTDFTKLIAIDTKTLDTLDIELGQLAKYFDFFLPWAGMEKMVYRGENPADVKAAEKMADFFDHIKATNYPANTTKEQLHEMVVFLNRLLFCFFAEDTKIFPKPQQFTNLLNQHTQEDGSDLSDVFERLFDVLNTPAHQRNDLPKYLNDFPYVNGGLFKKGIELPSFDAKARRMLLDSGSLDWSDINPDIFGSMIQGVADPDTRSKMGMHYTSVSNIMKVIEPLFLNDLYEEFDKCNDNINKLKKLQVRLSRIKFFDPACGSGNFLIITYKEVRELEIEILKRIRELEGESDSGAMGLFDESHSSIRLEQFYGIELDDFAHEMAVLSLWLVEHQMNMVFETEFGFTAPTLPLKQSGRIVAGNAVTLDWELVCPMANKEEVYILGNPPYLGSNQQSKEQKKELVECFNSVKGVKNLDYVCCWLMKSASLIASNTSIKAAFVTTNSVTQGEHVPVLWPIIFELEVEIGFAHKSFKWANNAKDKAAVSCVIIGLRAISDLPRLLFTNLYTSCVKNISPYLIDYESLIVDKRRKNISDIKPMLFGSKLVDGGNLILSDDEKRNLIESSPQADKLIKRLYGADEFVKGNTRWCLWISDEDVSEAREIDEIRERLENVRTFRLNSSKQATKNSASMPHKFGEIRHTKTNSIIVPRLGSERREYLLAGFLDGESVILDRAQAIPNATLFEFAVISSKMHMAWASIVCGRFKTDINYSSSLCYNTFPIPKVSNQQREDIETAALNILAEREAHPDKTMAELYDPDKMPEKLRITHRSLDSFFDALYQKNEFETEDDRLVSLFNLYKIILGD
jgi:hypothetical protein